jgi:hypothetical protein
VDVKEAVVAARKYAQELYPDAVNIRLEEVEVPEDAKGSSRWDVTLSFQLQSDPVVSDFLGEILLPGQAVGRRAVYYKIFRVNPDGSVGSMKIRKTPS